MLRSTLASLAALSMGLAGVSTLAPAPAAAQQAGVLPSDPQDFQCFVLMQQRRSLLMANTTLPAAQRVDILNNLTIISAFYAGRISHYSSADAVAQFRSAQQAINGASPAQLDEFANVCANFYLSVMQILDNTSRQANTVQQVPQTGIPQGQR
ncbi:hypothetical protein OZN62_02150 [Aurantiacibacter sp. MUD11]|uniref:hypothetical protein n=1 Tax=Aurantiacibacter sp. MUD11 TaxID=3003265 RepID=UPI0022AAF804|nr:hypothetical protein [Aurantiacibacter sp. MUD11]WAT18403.1 hypothetical protein OZN62_02150 [Aurantiacibacter sp. MUD11]